MGNAAETPKHGKGGSSIQKSRQSVLNSNMEGSSEKKDNKSLLKTVFTDKKKVRSDVSPFREGQLELVQESQILGKLIHPKRKKANQDILNDSQKNMQVRKIKDNQLVQENLEQKIIELIQNNEFQQKDIDLISQNFEFYSKDNIIGRYKMLQYFNMDQLEDSNIGNQFFQCAKNTFSQKQTGQFLDFSKFLKTISMLKKEGSQGRLSFIYQLFDLDLMGKVEKSEMKQVFSMFLESMTLVDFDNQCFPKMNELKNEIIKMEDKIVEAYIDQILNEIYDKKQELTFDEWKKWLYSIEGFEEIIEQMIPNM